MPNALKISFALFFFSLLIFLINIQSIRGYVFDETHYVPAAKEFIAQREYRNLEQPPLAKIIISIGISKFGDNPLGWRILSSVFGALTLVGIYILALMLFKKQEYAIWVALITLSNQLLYVQARVGMLDVFMFAFILWGFVFFYHAWTMAVTSGSSHEKKFIFMTFSGIMFGLSIACKWFGLIPLVYCVCLLIFSRFSNPKQFRCSDLFFFFGCTPLFFYFLTYIPWLLNHHSIRYWAWDFIVMQINAWNLLISVKTAHLYSSHWLGWPLLVRPIWYAFESIARSPHRARGVIMMGNPLIMWTGIPALIYCLSYWFADVLSGQGKGQSKEAFFIFSSYCALYFSWAFFPRNTLFYYYYYPAGMLLGLAIGFALIQFEKNGLSSRAKWIYASGAATLFVYFYPILSGSPILMGELHHWIWFKNWR